MDGDIFLDGGNEDSQRTQKKGRTRKKSALTGSVWEFPAATRQLVVVQVCLQAAIRKL
jgi:hypothetical protein